MTPERRRALAENFVDGIPKSFDLWLPQPLSREMVESAFLALEEEVREECAKVCDMKHDEFSKRSYPPPTILRELAAAIRALGEDK